MLRTRVRVGKVSSAILSLVAALLLTIIQTGDAFVSGWAPEEGKTTVTTLRVPYGPRLLPSDQNHYAYLHQIVPAGTVLLPDQERTRVVLADDAVRRPPQPLALLGMFAVLFTLCMTLTSYLRRFGQNRLKLLRSQVGLLAGIVTITAISKLFLLFSALPEYWLPAATLPLWVAVSFDRRTAIIVGVVLGFVLASLLRFDLLLLCVLLCNGLGGVLLFRERKRPRHMVSAGLLGGMCTAGIYASLVESMSGHLDAWADLSAPAASNLLACVGGGAAAGLLGAVLSRPMHRLFGNVSRDRLLDLTDLEQPLLKKMATEAPGSWEHARAMANLAEAATSAIGGDALLTRVGAYYHDLGKTIHKEYFVENLAPGEESPHDSQPAHTSARRIIAHVVEGTRILRAGGIPEPVVEFCYTHHGTQVVEYFWNKCKQEGNPEGLTEEDFRYPGMKPQTKETAILMLVDSIEAASRTIDPPNREQFEIMIQRIVFTKLAHGQLDESGLSMKDLNVLITRMTDTLVNMNHHRIKYPWQAKQAEEFGVPSQAVQSSLPPAPPKKPAAGDLVAVTEDSTTAENGDNVSELPSGNENPVPLLSARRKGLGGGRG